MKEWSTVQSKSIWTAKLLDDTIVVELCPNIESFFQELKEEKGASLEGKSLPKDSISRELPSWKKVYTTLLCFI
ncbi:hypothetical protein KQX54_002894 [Cotesia glomerata]|uniref:Uncharacterized protein n=1 Tax=Cotesia glomerata TaxID=32391 RepID=A0AAV7J3U9_COTGL|nr:hypothetical protein KQX54_002894 [Cotesia glomerata]